MPEISTGEIITDKYFIESVHLNRKVFLDCYYPSSFKNIESFSLLLVNDGQDLRTMEFEKIIGKLCDDEQLEPLFVVGIHCAPDRRNEYGTAHTADYKGRGAKAGLYTKFVFEELLPFIRKTYSIVSFRDKSFAGFSLGGLCALDIVWNHPDEFFKAGVFSGSLWWRDKAQEDEDFDEDTNRIMQHQIRTGLFAPWLKFFFEVGTMDEVADRNFNGVIDSIDDTLATINELVVKGYDLQNDIKYLELKDGKHDVPTWARAFPAFLKWGWGKERGVG